MSSVHTQNCFKKKQHQKLQLLVGFFSCFESWKHNILLKSSEIFHLFLRRCERWESLKLSSELKYIIYITQILPLIVYIWEQVWSTENPNYTKHDNMKEKLLKLETHQGKDTSEGMPMSLRDPFLPKLALLRLNPPRWRVLAITLLFPCMDKQGSFYKAQEGIENGVFDVTSIYIYTYIHTYVKMSNQGWWFQPRRKLVN